MWAKVINDGELSAGDSEISINIGRSKKGYFSGKNNNNNNKGKELFVINKLNKWSGTENLKRGGSSKSLWTEILRNFKN